MAESSTPNILQELNLKKLELSALLEITQAINENLPEAALYKIYRFTLLAQLQISRLVLYVHDEEWECKADFGTQQDFKKQELKFELKWGFPSIHGVEIDYGSDYYFEGYPDHVFLKLAFSGVHKTIDNPAMNHITIPVRNNQMGSILKGIERYQQKTLAKELKRDRLH